MAILLGYIIVCICNRLESRRYIISIFKNNNNQYSSFFASNFKTLKELYEYVFQILNDKDFSYDTFLNIINTMETNYKNTIETISLINSFDLPQDMHCIIKNTYFKKYKPVYVNYENNKS